MLICRAPTTAAQPTGSHPFFWRCSEEESDIFEDLAATPLVESGKAGSPHPAAGSSPEPDALTPAAPPEAEVPESRGGGERMDAAEEGRRARLRQVVFMLGLTFELMARVIIIWSWRNLIFQKTQTLLSTWQSHGTHFGHFAAQRAVLLDVVCLHEATSGAVSRKNALKSKKKPDVGIEPTAVRLRVVRSTKLS